MTQLDDDIKQLIETIGEVNSYEKITRLTYRKALKSFCMFAGGLEYALSATADDVDRWLESLVADGLTPSLIQSLDLSLSAVFSALYALGEIPSNPLRVRRKFKPYDKPVIYHNPVPASDMRKIIETATTLCLAPTSTKRDVALGVTTILHVKYCLPYNSLTSLRMEDYSPGKTIGTLTWRHNKSGNTYVTELDKETTQCLNRHMIGCGKRLGSEHLFATPIAKKKGKSYSRQTMQRVFREILAEAGVALEGRSLKMGALELALDAGASPSEIRACLPSISIDAIDAAIRNRRHRSESEILDRYDMELRRKPPLATGTIEAYALYKAIEKAGIDATLEFTVTSEGELEFNVCNDARGY